MGAAFTIYNLYELTGGSQEFLLVKAILREFSNADQSAEDAVRTDVDSRFSTIVASQQPKLQFNESRFIATWEDAWPEHDIFYSDESEIALEIWYSIDHKYGRYFVFGIAETEEQFWNQIREQYDDGSLWGFDEFSRPATRVRTWLVQDRDITNR